MENLAKAIIKVMKEVKGVEKNLTVGSGNNSYKGVSDQDVKKLIGDAMAKHGLCIIPIGIEPKTQIDRWIETGQYGDKHKQQIFSEVITRYKLLHESGESMEISGYGHGVDTQDKSAGKATTYALKYALLYTFLVPTGKIDDADNHSSEDIEPPKNNTKKAAAQQLINDIRKEELTPKHIKWQGAITALVEGKTTIDKIAKAYELTDENRELLLSSAL